MYHHNGHFFGMHFLGWIIWIIVLLWIFVIPYNFPGHKTKFETPFNVLKKRFAKGETSKEEYEEKKKILKINEQVK